MSLIHGFPPVAAPGVRRLVFGSLTGRALLRTDDDYANERNAYWRIKGDLHGASCPAE
jgi:G:T/U-mismatch repair DNA glycosylase